MKKLFVSGLAAIFFSLLVFGTGLAQYSGPPNVVGLFEFPDGSGATGTSVVGDPITIYLVLLKPADEQNGDTPYTTINAYECMLNFIPPDNLFHLGSNLPTQGSISGDQNMGQGYLEYIVGFAHDFPVTEESVQLMTIHLIHTAPGDIYVTLGPIFNPNIPDEMAYQSVEGDLRVMHSIGGSHVAAVFSFSHGLPVETESFGSVKALYR